MKRGDCIKWGGIIGAAIAVLNYAVLALVNLSDPKEYNFFTKLLVLPLTLCGKLLETLVPSMFEGGAMSGLSILLIFPIFMVLVGLLVGFIISLFISKK